MSKKKDQSFIQMDYKLEISFCPSTGKRTGLLQTEPGDTPEHISQAQEVLRDFLAESEREPRSSPKLMNTSHALKGFIEKVMERIGAKDFEDVGAVWREMVASVDKDDAPSHVIGYVKGKGIKYQGVEFDRKLQGVVTDRNDGWDYFTRDALATFFSRQKTYAGTRQPTGADEQ